jgi:hypothetical protein
MQERESASDLGGGPEELWFSPPMLSQEVFYGPGLARWLRIN